MTTGRFIDEHGELEHVELDGDDIILGGDGGRLQAFELTREGRIMLYQALLEHGTADMLK